MSTIHSRFATQLGKKILHEDREYILEKVSLSHLECMNGTTDLKPFVISECSIVFNTIKDFMDSGYSRHGCVIKTTDRYVRAEEIMQMTPEEISELVLAKICSCSEIEVSEIRKVKRTRKRLFVWTRYIHMSVMNMLIGYSLTKTGNIYRLDHATVIHARKTVINLLENDIEFQSIYKPAFDVIVDIFGYEAVRKFQIKHMYPDKN